ncbi:MAG: tRNA lysidine(34) synthetase TilS [Clostridia bacterium]|nr:tRNA lysidine(34) synthetase TilS [Clostridia bacterium]
MLNHNITFEILEKIKKADCDFSLFDGCKKILVALSGGADSCCLLLSLASLSCEYGFSLYALHINHGIRGEEADRDEAFCRKLCNDKGIPFYCEKADIPSLSQKEGISTELCARNVRYSLFEHYCSEYGFDSVAVAHNACDNTETVLFNLVRGSSLKGLCGIPPKRRLCEKAHIIRPLIYVTRGEIEDYLAFYNQGFVTDSSNLTDDYTRNFLRHEIIPSLKKINPSLESALLRSSKLLSMDSHYLEGLALCKESFKVSELACLDRCILSRIIKNMFSTVSSVMPEHKHINALCDKIYEYASKPSTNFCLSFPDKKKACVQNGILCFKEDKRDKNDKKDYNILLKEGINIIEGTDFSVFLSFDKSIDFAETITYNNEIIYKKYTTDYLYSDKIPDSLFARNRKPGDTIFCNGINKSVKRLMCEKKLDVDDRLSLPLICDIETGKIILVPNVAKKDDFCDDGKANSCVCVAIYRR